MSERPLILIADDDPELRQMMRMHIEMTDCEVLEANDGADALDLILTEHPDLVILDVMMPELTGWEVLRYVRSKKDLSDIGVLMLTGIGPSLNELSSPIYGADDYIDKPFKLDELLSKTQKILELRRNKKQ